MLRIIGAAILTLAALLIIGMADFVSMPEHKSEADCMAAALRPIAKERCQRNWQEKRVREAAGQR